MHATEGCSVKSKTLQHHSSEHYNLSPVLLLVPEELNLPLFCHMAALMRAMMTHDGSGMERTHVLCSLFVSWITAHVMDSFFIEWTTAVGVYKEFLQGWER